MPYSRWLVCGSRTKGRPEYSKIVERILDERLSDTKAMEPRGSDWNPECIIHGCCQDSADAYAEKWAERKGIKIDHNPATEGNYLKRNIEMVKKADLVVAFWDGFSYGTAQTIAQAVMRRKPIKVINLGAREVV